MRGIIYISGKITGNENAESEFAECERHLSDKQLFPFVERVINPYKEIKRLGLQKASYAKIYSVCCMLLDKANIVCRLKTWKTSDGASMESLIAYRDGKLLCEFQVIDGCPMVSLMGGFLKGGV